MKPWKKDESLPSPLASTAQLGVYQAPLPSRWPSVSVQERLLPALVVHLEYGGFGIATSYLRPRDRALVISTWKCSSIVGGLPPDPARFGSTRQESGATFTRITLRGPCKMACYRQWTCGGLRGLFPFRRLGAIEEPPGGSEEVEQKDCIWKTFRQLHLRAC